jgi:hypothetical protein
MAGEAAAELVATAAFEALLQQTTRDSFEDLFHDLMAQKHNGYLPVRRSGDQGADGLGIWNRRLFACYGSTTADPEVAIRKFREDLRSACTNRRGEFSEFVFVHNDTGGSHPDLSRQIARAGLDYPEIVITPWGQREVLDLFLDLEYHQQRRVLGRDLDVGLMPRAGLDEVGDVLDALTKQVEQLRPDDLSRLPLPKPDKLDFNRIEGWEHNFLCDGWKHTGLVDSYYRGHRDMMAEPLAAQALNSRYEKLRGHGLSPNEITCELLVYVTGGAPSGAKLVAAYTVLAYFLQRCHIFENPPDDPESRG